MSEFTIPGGPEKGTPISQASPSTVDYWADRIDKSLKDGTSRNPDLDKRLLLALRGAQGAASSGPAPQGQAQGRRRTTTQRRPAPQGNMPSAQAALARPTPANLVKLTGAFHSPDQVTHALQEAAQQAHLVTPQTACGALPLGTSVTMSVVWVDANTETYGIPHQNSDRRGLDKTALVKIANAAGLSWEPGLSGRLDDGSDPHYCHYRAVARVKNFDGTERIEMGSVEMDLREGSETAEETEARARANNKPNTELQQMRRFILRHAESKAMNRVIRRLGIRTSYMRHELDRPFVVARSMFTGHTDDPDLKKLAFEKTFDIYHGARQALYAAHPPALTAAIGGGHAPPPLAAGQQQQQAHSSGLDDEGYGDYLEGEYEDDQDGGPTDQSDDAQPYAAENYQQQQQPAAQNQPQQQELKT